MIYIFRGRELYNQEWVYGYHSVFHITEKDKIHMIYSDERSYRVVEETIGLSSGFFDSAKKLCYEGDLVDVVFYLKGNLKLYKMKKRGLVVFEEGCFRVKFPYSKEGEQDFINMFEINNYKDSDKEGSFFIIGDIHKKKRNKS